MARIPVVPSADLFARPEEYIAIPNLVGSALRPRASHLEGHRPPRPASWATVIAGSQVPPQAAILDHVVKAPVFREPLSPPACSAEPHMLQDPDRGLVRGRELPLEPVKTPRSQGRPVQVPDGLGRLSRPPEVQLDPVSDLGPLEDRVKVLPRDPSATTKGASRRKRSRFNASPRRQARGDRRRKFQAFFSVNGGGRQ